MRTFKKTKFYPVNYTKLLIIDSPFKKEKDIFLKYKGTGFIGIKGNRLNIYNCYEKFKIKGI